MELRSEVGHFLKRLPAAPGPIETSIQTALLLETALRFGQKAHEAFHSAHQSRSIRRCSFRTESALASWSADDRQSGHQRFRGWADAFIAEFYEAHPSACAAAAQQYVAQHYRRQISLPVVAGHAGCTAASLKRRFKDLTGLTLREYQAELRITEALRLLAETDLKIEAIARDVGYSAKKDLYRLVRSRLGCTPLEYRARSRRHPTSAESDANGIRVKVSA